MFLADIDARGKSFIASMKDGVYSSVETEVGGETLFQLSDETGNYDEEVVVGIPFSYEVLTRVHGLMRGYVTTKP